MSITISGGGGVGITIESDPTAVKLVGSTMSGELTLPQLGNVLNSNLVIDSYNDTGAGTHYYHTFTPFDGKFNLAPNGGGLTFPNGTTQVTSALPLTGGTLSGKVNLAPLSAASASLNLGIGTAPTTTVAGDIWIATNINYKDNAGTQKAVANTNTANTFTVNQVITAATTGPLLRVTQTGTGNALVVEDANPDGSAFIIDQFGKVGIGVAPDATAAVTVDSTGIKFGANATVQSVSSVVTATGTYDKEIPIQINGVNYRISCREG